MANGRDGKKALLPKLDPNNANPGVEVEREDEPVSVTHDGAGGASLIIYGLMAIVLVWAPRNEIHCVWIGFRAGTFEFEYLYFCGFYIVIEVLSAVFSARGFEVTSEVGHATGAMVGFGLGTLFVKQNWVDCENWDLYSVISGKHDAAIRVGEWQNNVIVRSSRKKDWIAVVAENSREELASMNLKKKKKKAKPKSKLIELESLDDAFESIEEDPIAEAPHEQEEQETEFLSATPDPPPTLPTIPRQRKGSRTAPTNRIRERVFEGDFQAALREYLEHRAFDSSFQLDEEEHRLLADGLFKAKATADAALLLDEYIRRFHNDADRQRVKLSVLYVKFMGRPTAALKMLAKMDANVLPDDYRLVYRKVVKEAQQMIADGKTDAQN